MDTTERISAYKKQRNGGQPTARQMRRWIKKANRDIKAAEEQFGVDWLERYYQSKERS